MLTIRCPHCKKPLRLQGATPGVQVKCPGCQATLRLPATLPAEAPDATPKPAASAPPKTARRRTASCAGCSEPVPRGAAVCASCVGELSAGVTGKRLLAWAVDMGGLLVPSLALLGMIFLRPQDPGLFFGMMGGYILIGSILLYILILRHGTTFGMQLAGLRITDIDGRRARALPALQVAFPGRAARVMRVAGQVSGIAPACVLRLPLPSPPLARVGPLLLGAIAALGIGFGLLGGASKNGKDTRTSSELLAAARVAPDDEGQRLLALAIDRSEPRHWPELRQAALLQPAPDVALRQLAGAGDTTALGELVERLGAGQTYDGALEQLRRLSSELPLDARLRSAFQVAPLNLQRAMSRDLRPLWRDEDGFAQLVQGWSTAIIDDYHSASEDRAQAIASLLPSRDEELFAHLFGKLRQDDAEHSAQLLQSVLARKTPSTLIALVEGTLPRARCVWPSAACCRLLAQSAEHAPRVREWIDGLLDAENESHRARGLQLALALGATLRAQAQGDDLLRWERLIGQLQASDRSEAGRLAAQLAEVTRDSGIRITVGIVQRMLASDQAAERAHGVRMLGNAERADLLTWASAEEPRLVEMLLQGLRGVTDEPLAAELVTAMEGARE